ncbi:MAG: hypothetical protein AMXMBFR79_17770 [Chitinophagaceae bacterium]
MKNLAIIITHPIQYYAPVFQLLAKRCNLKVFYTWGEDVLKDKYDPGFGKIITWDIPLLEGYEYEFVKNISTNPGSHAKDGINNPDLIKSIESWKADAVLIFGWNFISHLQTMKYFKGKIPVLFRGDSTLLDKASFIKKMVRKFYLSYVYRYIDYALYVGTANKKYFTYCGLKNNQLVFAPHAIDNHRFSSINENHQQFITEAKNKFQIKDTDTTFLFCGKFEEVKNPFLLLRAFNKMAQPNVHLIFVGNGALENTMKQEAKNNKQIHFLPFQNQSFMPAVYRLGDVYCLPSFSETWGLAINEAMASGKAIVASDKVGCAVDLIQDGVNGYIFKSNNQQDLLEKLILMSNSKEQLAIMGKKSFDLIQAWSFEAIADSVADVINTNTR